MRKISLNLLCPNETKQQVTSVITWTEKHTITCKPKANRNIALRSRFVIVSGASEESLEPSGHYSLTSGRAR